MREARAMRRRFQFHLLTLLICQPFAAFILYIIVRMHSYQPHDAGNWITTLILVCSIVWFACWTEWFVSYCEWLCRKREFEQLEKRALEQHD
jgi:hypothetical protein